MNKEESQAVAAMAAVCAEMASLSWSTQEQMDIARKASAALRAWLAVKECARAEGRGAQNPQPNLGAPLSSKGQVEVLGVES